MGVDMVLVEEKSTLNHTSISVHRLNTLLREGAVSEKKNNLRKACLSYETFLGLIAALWRDLLDSFIPTKIDMLSQFRHMHLLPLIWYCNEEHQDDHGGRVYGRGNA